MNFLFVEQPIYLLGIFIVFIAAIAGAASAVLRRRHRGLTAGQVGQPSSRRLLIQMIATPIFYAFLTYALLTIINLDMFVNDELNNGLGSGAYGQIEMFLIPVMFAACCISLYKPIKRYQRIRSAERSEVDDGKASGGDASNTGSAQPIPKIAGPPVASAADPVASPASTAAIVEDQRPRGGDAHLHLQQLKEMLDAGLINQQDYDEQKKKILEKV
jgi:hypothetical protein